MHTQINKISDVKLDDNSCIINNSGSKIEKQNNFLIFKISPLFIKMFNDIYDVRKAIVRFATFIYMVLCFIGLVLALYTFKIKGSDLSFDLIGAFLLSIIILVLYNLFNKVFYKEFERFKKSEKIVFLFVFDIVVWGFLSYLIL